MSLPEPQIQSLQAKEKILTAARNAGKINMSLPEPQSQSLQVRENVLTAARRGGNINMDQLETEVGLQAMAQVRGRSVDELAARDAAKSVIAFTATENDEHLDVMRREEFEGAGKILDDYSDRSAIASIVKDTPPPKKMRRGQATSAPVPQGSYQRSWLSTSRKRTNALAHTQSQSFQSLQKKRHTHSYQTTSVGHTRSQSWSYTLTKIENHIGTLHQGRAHVTMLHAGNARWCVRLTVTTHGRWPGLEIHAIMIVGWCNWQMQLARITGVRLDEGVQRKRNEIFLIKKDDFCVLVCESVRLTRVHCRVAKANRLSQNGVCVCVYIYIRIYIHIDHLNIFFWKPLDTMSCRTLESVRVALFYYTDIGESLWSRGFLRAESKPRRMHPRLKITDFPPHSVSHLGCPDPHPSL